MGLAGIISFGRGICAGVVKKADDVVQAGLTKTGKAITKNIKIPDKLASLLYDAGIDVSKKNTRRTVEAALKHQALYNIDSAVSTGTKIFTSGMEPEATDFLIEGIENMAQTGAIRPLSLAKASDNARNLLSFRYENLPQSAQNAIRKFMNNPINAASIYAH